MPGDRVDVAGQPFTRPSLDRPADSRNPFQKHSDTRALEPISLKLPPWVPLAFELPPTVPGPAPAARRLLRGEIPTLKAGDGTTIAEIPQPAFSDYQPVADDLYDWVVDGGRKTYVYVRAIKDQGTTFEEGKEGFERRLLQLARREPGWETMTVEYALIGSEDTAAKNLTPTDVVRLKRLNVATAPADQFDRWFPRRSVANLYRETLLDKRLGWDPAIATNLADLRDAAQVLADVGRTGKEQREGWRRASELLEIAMRQARDRAPAEVRAQILGDLVAAYAALKDEPAVLRTLSEFARVSPGQPEPWLYLGHLHLRALGLAEEALAYYQSALERSPRHGAALLGTGDALTVLGRHREALEAYRKAGVEPGARVRVAEALLRLGDLVPAEAAAAQALSEQPDDPRVLLAVGGIQYAQGDATAARESFSRAAASTGPEALDLRAQACYDLGLACWRLGQCDAALAAFEACDVALQHGSSPQRTADETVSPDFGRALVALAAGDDGALRASLSDAREEAPRVAYHEVFAGMVASRAEDDALAVRAFERAIRLARVYPELDGWLALTRLRIGQLQLATGTPIKEAGQEFEAAVAYATRANQTEEKSDPRAFEAALREAWIRLGAEHLPVRHRFESARDVVDRVLTRIDREQPAALAIRAYCHYRLAPFGLPAGSAETDPYDPCLRDFQQVLNKVPEDDTGPWKAWRAYAVEALAQVKHWQNLEEKVVVLEEGTLPPGFEADESGGVKMRIEDGVVKLDDAARRDGSLAEPIFRLSGTDLFQVGTLEEVRLLLKIPRRDASSSALNTITFGVQVERGARGGVRGAANGVGIFYDQGKIAAREGGGQDEDEGRPDPPARAGDGLAERRLGGGADRPHERRGGPGPGLVGRDPRRRAAGHPPSHVPHLRLQGRRTERRGTLDRGLLEARPSGSRWRSRTSG